MSLFDRSCQRQREDIALLASGALPPAERPAVEQHLAACPACREYFAQIKTVTDPLMEWAQALPSVEPSPAMQNRWVQAIHSASQSAPAPGRSPVAAFHEWANDVIWPWRRAWAGLAMVWMLIAAGNLSLREHSSLPLTRTSVPPQAMVMAFKDQQRILAELLADHTLPREADRPRHLSPKPHAQTILVATA